jgi:hypothetical protein
MRLFGVFYRVLAGGAATNGCFSTDTAWSAGRR